MSLRFVIDTSSFIDYFDNIFGVPSVLSKRVKRIIGEALSIYPGNVKLSIPSIVLIEIYEKWLRNEEFASKFYYEVYHMISISPNIEIKPIEREVLENLLIIKDKLDRHDMHDKIILSSAMMLKCPLITRDPDIIQYVNANKVIPFIIN